MLQELNKPFHIGTARFTDETYNQNLNWKKRKKWDGCCYGFDKKLPTTIKTGELVFIVEMNNSQNMIMGIGLIQNHHRSENRTRIYTSETWNQHVYKSEYHINRANILKKPKGEHILLLLERLLFYGYSHFKRGQGCLTVPYDRISTWGPQKLKKLSKSSDQKAKLKSKKCHICGKRKKGHICPAKKKNLKLLNVVLTFFKELFH